MPYLSPPKKTKQIPPLKFSKKNRVSTAKSKIPKFAIPSSAAPKPLLPWWQIFEKSHGFTHQVSGFTFPTNCPHSILPILAVFFVKFPAKRLWGKGCFSKMCFVSGCGGNTQSEFKAMSITWWFNKAPSNSRLWANHANFVGGKTCEVQGALVVCMFYLYIPPISDMTASCVSLIPLQWARLLKLNRRKYKG